MAALTTEEYHRGQPTSRETMQVEILQKECDACERHSHARLWYEGVASLVSFETLFYRSSASCRTALLDSHKYGSRLGPFLSLSLSLFLCLSVSLCFEIGKRLEQPALFAGKQYLPLVL